MDKQKKEELKKTRNKLKETRLALKREKENRYRLFVETKEAAEDEFNKKFIELKSKYQQDLVSVKSKEEKNKIKHEFNEALFNLQCERDYRIAKNQVTEQKQKKAKMIVDKKRSYKQFDLNSKKLDEAFKTNIVKLQHDIKSKRAELMKIRNDKSLTLQQRNENISKKIKEIDQLDNEIIKHKISYENTQIQLKMQRDMSYEYELDKSFILKRWWYGVGKDAQRMSWPTWKRTVSDFATVISVSVVIALLFLLIDFIVSKL